MVPFKILKLLFLLEVSVPLCTLVIPIYNEQNRFSLSDFEILLSQNDLILTVIDDGSSDLLAATLETAYGQNSNFQLVKLTTNQGKAEAVRQGFLRAMVNKSEYIAVMDGDFSYSASEFLRFYSFIKSSNLDAISGVRTLSNSLQLILSFRLWQGIAFRYFINLVFSNSFRDIQCGLKVFKSEAISLQSIEKKFEDPWLYDLEILLRNKARIHSYGELRIEFWEHKEASKLNLNHVPGILINVFRLRHYFGTLTEIKRLYIH